MKVINNIIKQRDLTPLTKTQYINQLRKLQRFVSNKDSLDDVSFLKNVNKVLEFLRTLGSKYTVKNYLAVIVTALKTNGNDCKLIEKYTEIMNAFSDNLFNEEENQIMSKKTKKKWMDWKDIIKLRDNLKKSLMKKMNLHKLKRYVILSLYTYFPPRRNKDYVNMRILENVEDLKDNENAIIGDNKKRIFVFQDYKTSKAYGIQYFKVPKDLNNVINLWLTAYPNNKYLLGDSNAKTVMDNLKRLDNNRGLTTTILRKSFITDFYSKNPKLKEKNKIAQKMGHDKSIAERKYYKPE